MRYVEFPIIYKINSIVIEKSLEHNKNYLVLVSLL